MLATHLSYCSDEGMVSNKMLKFYEERARHKPGLIVVGGCFTEHLGMGSPTMIGISKDEHIPGLRELVNIIHSYDVPVLAQLYHAGRYAYSFILGEQAVSASAIPSRITKETPRELSIDEINQTVNNFGIAAKRAKSAGFDGVEIIGSAGYIINQFLALATNKRIDEYGGSLEQRVRFPIEIIKSVRKCIGNDLAIFYRMSGEDFVEDGLTLNDNKIIAPLIENAGIDCFDVTGGWHEARIPQITMDVPRGHYAYLAEGIADSVSVPVVACNRINSPTIAERILQREKVQLIGMSRALIADPSFPSKVRHNKFNQILPCIGCNLGCLDMVFTLQPLTCALNPQAGYEGERKNGSKGEGSIGVIGAGPSGIVAAKNLSDRGFDVTLYEKEKVIGGSLTLASRVPGRGEFAAYIGYMWKELRRLGVSIRTGINIRVNTPALQSHDMILCATGALPTAPEIDGVEMPHVITVVDMIRNRTVMSGIVGILGSDAIACYGALYAAKTADEIHMFPMGERLGSNIGRSTRWVIMKDLRNHGVQIHDDFEVTSITDQYLMIDGSEYSNLFKVDSIVLGYPPIPDSYLADSLQKRGFRVESIGNATKVENLLECIHNTFLFTSEISI